MSLFLMDTKDIQRQVEKLLNKGYMRQNMSLCAVHVLLVPNKDGVWRVCVDSQDINNITMKYHHHIPK
uniref:Reverse transcriptase domain-containing protein n=1 Tax=Solanum lycopersicum TaxID=4081 RepID=A0A3Q7GGZ1_SOLLC